MSSQWPHGCPITRHQTLGGDITTDEGSTYLLVPPLLRKSWQSQTKLTRERSGYHRGKTASSQNVKSRTFLSIPPSLSDHPFPNSYTMKFFMLILYSCFASICPRKIMPLFTYIQLQITAGFPCHWWSYSFSHLKFLPKLQGLNFSGTSSALLCHEPKTQTGISWRYSWFQICFHWQIPTPMARSKCKWGYDQESLNSWKYCRICY